MFSAALAGATPPRPPALDLVFVVLGQVFSQLCSKIQEAAEDKAENPGTCRGQGREENPYERLPENSNLKALFSQTPFPYRNAPDSENVGRRYSPLGGFNPPPNRGRRVRLATPGLRLFFAHPS